MNEFLAQYYGTSGADAVESTESAEKTAQVELFAKLAEENGIDLNALSDEQVEQLWTATFSEKTASEEESDDEEEKDEPKKEEKKDEKEEKKAAAEVELAEKRAASEKFAEADFLGRVMAHSYVNELDKISAARGEGESKEAGWKTVAMHAKGKELAGKAGDAAKAGLNKAKDYAAKGVEAVGTAVESKRTGVDKHTIRRAAGQDAETARKVMSTGAKTIGGAAAGAAAVGGAAASKKSEKKASALVELAAESALAKIAESEFDLDEAAEKIAAVITLTGGEFEGTKVASAGNVDEAVEIRSLELLEAAGYPVTWNG